MTWAMISSSNIEASGFLAFRLAFDKRRILSLDPMIGVARLGCDLGLVELLAFGVSSRPTFHHPNHRARYDLFEVFWIVNAAESRVNLAKFLRGLGLHALPVGALKGAASGENLCLDLVLGQFHDCLRCYRAPLVSQRCRCHWYMLSEWIRRHPTPGKWA